MKGFSSFVVFLLLTTSCSKKNFFNKTPVSNSVVAKWTYSEYFESPGAGGAWHAVSPPNQQIEFKSDGSFTGAPSFLPDVIKYELLDSITIKFQPGGNSQGFIEMGYHIDTAMRQLFLYPVNPSCIEGCSNKFIR